MKTVWIVEEWIPYEGGAGPVAAFATEELAKDFVKKKKYPNDWDIINLDIIYGKEDKETEKD